MTIALLTLTNAFWLAAVVVLVRYFRADQRERTEAMVCERDVWHTERRDLLNKIHAPEAAQKQAELEVAKPDLTDPPFVGWDDDDAFHEARGVTDGVA